jgi:ATP-binding cassette, subfamily B, bacterial
MAIATPANPNPKAQPSWSERFIALKNIPPLLKLIWKTSPQLVIATACIRLLRSAVPVASLYIGKLIIDSIVASRTHGQEHQDATNIWFYVALECVLAISVVILGRVSGLLDGLLGDRFANETSVRIMEHSATLDLEMFEDAEFYDKLERARRQTWTRVSLMNDVLGQVQDSITIISFVVALVSFNPYLLLLVFVSIIPSIYGELKFSGESYSLAFQWTAERRKIDYYRFIGASDETAKEVKIFGLSPFIIARFKQLVTDYYTANRKLSIRRAIWGAVLSSVITLSYYSAYIVIISQALVGLITLGSLTFLIGSFQQVQSLLQSIFMRFTSIAGDALYLKDLFEFFEIKPSVPSPSSPHPFPEKITQGFVFENVSFKYRNNTKWAIRNLSFSLSAGEKLALVGENGAGKTTVVKLLARLYEPTEGRILLDGVDLREYDVNELRKHIGVIFQDFVRYQMTLGENIATGNITQHDNQTAIVESAEKSQADTVARKLEQGYDQVIGRRFAEGVDLSGGEWQKVALARAYLRSAQVLILDEPTAALDARAEYDIFRRFTELTQGKSAVLISHRFSTVRMADKVLVLNKGERVEYGSHSELMELNGIYSELFTLQAQGYQ